MALRDQPYLPLYIQDYLTDEKLNSCSAATQGVYIKIMCVLHKQESYGSILLKQKDKQTDKQILNFAYKFAKLLPFDTETIISALTELVEEDVITIIEDTLYQKRMVKDGQISEARSKAAKSGGGNPILFKQNPKQEFKQKDKQIPEYENENEIDNLYPGITKEITIDFEKSKIEFQNNYTLREQIMRATGFSEKQIDDHVNEFWYLNSSEYPRTWKETEKHIKNWFNKRKHEPAKDKPSFTIGKGRREVAATGN